MIKKRVPLIIDFVGRAGAGKTHVKNELLKELSEEYKCVDLSEACVTAKDYLDFIFTAPGAFLSSLKLILFNIPRSYPSMLKLFRKWFRTQIKLKKAHALDCDCVMNDEGLFIWWNWITNNTLKKITFCALPDDVKKEFFYPDLVFSVTADFGISEERRLKRDAGRKSSKKASKKKHIYDGQKLLLNNLQKAEKLGLVKVVNYNNEGRPDISLFNDIRAWIKGKRDKDA
jgi:hypothetical protein